METPKDVENTVFSYELNEKMLYGEKHKNFRSDLLTLVMVCLPRKINKEHTMQNMLRVLLDGDISVESKEDILSKEYGIKMDDNMKEEARYMCNLSDLVEERGIRKGMARGIESIVNILKKSGDDLEKICTIIQEDENYKDVSREKIEEIYNKLN